MNFGTSYTSSTIEKPCGICGKSVAPADKIIVERTDIHKQCFNCGVCDAALKQGSCAMEKGIYGLRWYCSGAGTNRCALLNKAEKEAKLKAKGAQPVKK
ncbi:LIM domain-containing protein [Ditylenchus destructor]|uniref:LIM domain-containing protein n=1 Tax=Ditylenchus destructor TaxID=166010 RepID=A0AAD4MJJ8_9BILA|nr:LIM domain-containing protein [Ditylenchus destructor]